MGWRLEPKRNWKSRLFYFFSFDAKCSLTTGCVHACEKKCGFKYCASNVGLAGPKIFFSLLVLIVDRFPHVAVPTMIL
jgi:hypothetical protein